MNIEKVGLYINGKIVDGSGSRCGEVFNPATGELTKTVAFATEAEVDLAVSVAASAFPAWAATPPLKRARVLFRFKEMLEAHTEELARLITSEHGKVLADARGSVLRGIEVVEFACGIPHLLKGSYTENVGIGVDSHSTLQPLGVCAGITPFNFPAMVPLWMFPIALACGNTFVLKVSEKTPGCAVRLAELLSEAGAPAGVLNVVNGDRETVDLLLAHPKIMAVSFVGSTPVAEHVYRTAAAHGKRVQTLGGAKNHAVIMPDADLDQAADALMGAAFGSAGERCMAISAAVAVGDRIGNLLVEKLRERLARLRVGPGVDDGMEMGPLVTSDHLQKVRRYLDLGIEEGAELVVDGRNLRVAGHEKGYFLGASLFDRVTPEMRIYREEIFGPVLAVVRVPDLGTALGLVNDCEYGNGTAIFTRDGCLAREFASRVQAGMVGINVPLPVPMAFHSFGGWKRSFFGDLHMHGPDGVRFYTRLKTVTGRWQDAEGKGPEFAMPTMK
ncbi:MAG TPA: CoA-acylating methylmalonate-semialdehyde dehydrogenase [Geobacteraceae bacterium]|nr:CoA-acylating methylmalonate-semialdehyde dehydrogenase [Geobacteraceae bacterium]